MTYPKVFASAFLTGRSRHRFFLAVMMLYALWGTGDDLYAKEKALQDMVDPHWSSKYCSECHESERPSEKEHVLRFDGDPVQLCNRCHLSEFARADLHPVDIKLPEKMKARYPGNWPLNDGKISCLTCHESLVQMEENPGVQKTNPKFLRGAPYGVLIEFCFSCHAEDDYKSKDPHKQLDKDGKVIENSCLFCHQSLPDPDVANNIGTVTFKDELAMNCVACHEDRKQGHPDRADHLLPMSEPMKERLRIESERLNIELPLDNETIFCGTCHNPHEKGVIQRKAVQAGAGEKDFLRMKDYDICLLCHPDYRKEKEKPQVRELIEVINPHWTGTHCQECHLDADPQGKKPALKFNGDSVQLCNRCHQAGLATTDSHPVEVAPGEAMLAKFPEGWSLRNDVVTCLTCHDVIPQMYADLAQKMKNPRFIRGAPYKKMTDFCFTCHIGENYQQQSPHNQLNDKGEIIEVRCLFCHQTLPDPESTDSIEDVTFKGDLSRYCVSCHASFKEPHPARADHMVELKDLMKDGLATLLKERGVVLPVHNNTINCATCHNPHEKGVIKRGATKHGSGEEYFLRLDKGYDLCVSCHADKHFEKLPGKNKESGPRLTSSRRMGLVPHKPWNEKKCRMCHVATVENREKPEAVSICFQEGCHNRKMLESAFTHPQDMLGYSISCYLCHDSHASSYGGLLKQDQEELCRSCHPHLKGSAREPYQPLETNPEAEERVKKTAKEADQKPEAEKEKFDMEGVFKKTEIQHSLYIDFLKTTDIPRENACGFCHNPDHQEQVKNIPLSACSSCHMFVQEIMSEAISGPVNVHQEFASKKCSTCHDAHSAPYEHLLKLYHELEQYNRTPYRPK